MSPRAPFAIAAVLAASFAAAGIAPEDPRAAAAEAFLDSLDEAGRDQASFAYDDVERLAWNFLPNVYRGVLLSDLDEPQTAALSGLLREHLSEVGRAKLRGVRWLEEVLFALESRPDRPADHRDPDRYWVAVFGAPGQGPWAWRLQGHHISLNFTADGEGGVAHAPLFLGANPRQVRGGERDGMALLAAEEDMARALLISLDSERLARATGAGDPPRDILMGPGNDAAPAAQGLPAKDMTPRQRGKLELLVRRFSDHLAPGLARAEATRAADLSRTRFLWIGSTSAGQPHYWRVHGPHFVLEWCTPQGDPGHVHCVWRDLERDLGRGPTGDRAKKKDK